MAAHVLIIGAGLGGLCLAQGLKKAGINVSVFERDSSNDYRAQGYRIRLWGPAIPALQHCLNDELYSLFERTCAETRVGPLPDVDPVAGTVETKAATAFPGGGGSLGPGGVKGAGPMFADPHTVDRTVLRQVLLTGLESNVHYGKELTHYQNRGTSAVIVYFKDNTSVTGTLVVGADGMRSQVRRQYLPTHAVLDTGGRIVYGKTLLTDSNKSFLNPGLLQRMTGIKDAQASIPTFTLLEPIVFPAISSRPQHPSLPQDYIYWVMTTPSNRPFPIPDDRLHILTTSESADLVLKLTEHWHPSIRSLFEHQDRSQSSVIRIYTAHPQIQSWEATPTVTLLGDACHVMPPTGASGAVTALRDAGNLAKLLVEQGFGKEAIAQYESEMRTYARETIEWSLAAGIKTFGQRGIEGARAVDFHSE